MSGLVVDQVFLAVLAIMKEDFLHIVESEDVVAQNLNGIEFLAWLHWLSLSTSTGVVWDGGIIDAVPVLINQIPVAFPCVLGRCGWHFS